MKKVRSLRAQDIDLIVYDFDGVMTDNKVVVFDDGREAVYCNRSDGLGVAMIREKKIPQLILSTEANKVVKARAKKLGIPVMNGIKDKKSVLFKYCQQRQINLKRVLYVGNDLNDYEIMCEVGVPVAPQDAHPSIKKEAKYIIPRAGGSGVIRALYDLLKT